MRIRYAAASVAALGALFLTGCGPESTPTPTATSAVQLDRTVPSNAHPAYAGTVYETYLETLDAEGVGYSSDTAAVNVAKAICDVARSLGADGVEPVLQSLMKDGGYTITEAYVIADAAVPETC